MIPGIMLLVTSAAVTAEGPPRVFILDGKTLLENRRRLRAGDRKLKAALDKLVGSADYQLKQGPFSVTDKAAPPPSGDKHDYQSLGPYWWPDPKKPDGKPYIRKDGQVNPERRKLGDSDRFGDMRRAVNALARAWYFTRDEKYAARATMLIRAWYLDPSTRMNPNMNYGQAIPGRCEGRGIGIVDAGSQPEIIDSVGLLEGSRSWMARDQKALVKWFDEFVVWLQTSKHGRDEDRTKNNHATQYDAQVAAYALFIGKPEIAKKVLAAVPKRRIDPQIKSDGSQPHELKRTKSWDYSCANTRNFVRLAVLGRHVDVDLWGYEKDGKSIKKAIDFLIPYATGARQWKHKQIKKFDPKRMLSLLLQASSHDDTGRYATVALSLISDTSLERLLYRQP